MPDVAPAAARPRVRLVAFGGGVPPRVRARRAVLGALVVAAAALAAILGLRSSSAFSVEAVRVRGVAGPTATAVSEEVRRLVADRGLLALDAAEVRRGVEALPFVRAATVDRAFPHTLAVRVTPEQPAAVVVSGSDALTVARSGRVLARTDARRRRTDLPLLAAGAVEERAGERIDDAAILTELAVAKAVPPGFGLRLASVQVHPDGLVVETRRGLRVELGDTTELADKLLAARAVAAAAAPDEPRLIDVTVPSLPAVSAVEPDDATLARGGAAGVGSAPPSEGRDVAVDEVVADLFTPVSI